MLLDYSGGFIFAHLVPSALNFWYTLFFPTQSEMRTENELEMDREKE